MCLFIPACVRAEEANEQKEAVDGLPQLRGLVGIDYKPSTELLLGVVVYYYV